MTENNKLAFNTETCVHDVGLGNYCDLCQQPALRASPGSSDSKRVSDERLAQLIEYVDWTARTDKAVDEVQAALRELQQLRAEKPHV